MDSDADPTTSATESTGAPSATTTGEPTTASTTDASDPGGTSATTSDGDSQPDDPPPPLIWDVLRVPDVPEEQTGCHAVDFLFVIDASGSMYSYQTNLVNNFGAFIEGIQSTLTEVESYHIGVTVATESYDYNVVQCQDMGALVVQTGGLDSSNQTCGPYADGHNFMTDADDLETEFTCAAQVGTQGGDYELTMSSMIAAVDGSLGGPGQCNEGFIRDDALLVIVIITDEADGPGDPEGGPPLYSSAGDPTSWYEAVIAAKGDIPENAAVLSLINYEGGPCPPTGFADDGENIATFTTLFGENGFLGGICEEDYAPIFTQAVGVIEGACENFVPN